MTREEILAVELPISRLSALGHSQSPLNAALVHLRRPFEPAAVRWKVQSAGSGYGIVVAYIDARLVGERLNAVVGGEWSDEFRAHEQGVEECALTVFGVTRRDVGTAGGFEAAKAKRSDALKRAGVKFGIGVSIYAMKSVLLDATSEKKAVRGENHPVSSQGARLLTHNFQNAKTQKWSARLSDGAEEYLARLYGRWLGTEEEPGRGIELFGPALAHGDESGAQGLEAEEGPAVAPPEEPSGGGPALEDERAHAAAGRIDVAYAAIKKMNGAQIPPGQHKARVKSSAPSHDELEKYADELERIRGEMEEARA